MDKYSSPSLGSLRKTHIQESTGMPVHLIPFGPKGGGQWTGHPVGLIIVVGFILMALVGVPEARFFFAASLGLGAILGCALWLWHRSKSPF
jgi:hypothetical protein